MGGGGSSGRKMTPKGQMSTSGSGPAIMMMPPHIRATFMPDPPIQRLPPPIRRRPKRYVNDKLQVGLSGVAQFLAQFERGVAPKRVVGPTPSSVAKAKAEQREEANQAKLKPLIDAYRLERMRDDDGPHPTTVGEYKGMNCYNTLFVGRLAYEVTERKLLREFETFGPIQDLKLIFDTRNKNKSRGFAFIEYEHEEDMKRAYRAADGMRIEGREIVVDVERGHTVPNWLPRRLGGGLGGTRLGGADKNITMPGRFDPSKPSLSNNNNSAMMGGGPPGYGGGGPPMIDDHRMPYNNHNGPPPPMRGSSRGPPYGDRERWGGGPYGGGHDDRRGGYDRYGPPPPSHHRGRYDRGDRGSSRYGGGDRGMKRGRSRSRSPDRRDSYRRGRY
jgi:U1 small nuclear ribonucleoprotein